MDKPKESQVRTRVMDILRNHDQEARVIEAQIAAEKESLEYDLEEILMSGAYPSTAINPTGVRASSPEPDGNLVRMVDRRDRRAPEQTKRSRTWNVSFARSKKSGPWS